ncbi:hypothetical protein [Amycolatopsis sp. NPDC051372]|uniref:hypothetical protein n=1 Tax=Amycolatopsis sp. NPDC051372 TaxID=3155669 RepID=UPI00344867B8
MAGSDRAQSRRVGPHPALHLCGFRELLAERLDLPGLPQVIFRYGHPVDPVPPSPRRLLADLLPD